MDRAAPALPPPDDRGPLAAFAALVLLPIALLALAGTLPELVADQSVARVEPDTDDVTLLELLDVERLEPLVTQDGVTPLGGSGRCQHVEPARGDEAGPEGKMTRVDDIYAHVTSFSKRIDRASVAEIQDRL